MGRPSNYTDEMGARICERIISGDSLRTICADDGMPDKATIFRWLARHESFSDQYARAKALQADHMAEEILEIADDPTHDYDEREITFNSEHVQRSRLRIDTRKWLMSKLAAKKYGDKQHIEHSGGVRQLDDMSDDELARIASGGETASEAEGET